MKKRPYAALLAALLAIALLTGCRAAAVEFDREKSSETEKSVHRPADEAGAKLLTEDEAKEAALKHGGFLAEEARFLRAQFDMDDSVPHYDVEFEAGQWEYEYEIDARTGEILSFERDD